MSVVLIQQEEIEEELTGGNEITAADTGFPIEDCAPAVESRLPAMRLSIGKGRTDEHIRLAFIESRDRDISRTDTRRQERQD